LSVVAIDSAFFMAHRHISASKYLVAIAGSWAAGHDA